MTASEVATMLHAKRIGKEKWVARCPSHDDRNPSLSIRDGKRGVMIKCFSQGCSVAQICDAMGISVEALFYDSGNRTITPEVRARMEAQERLKGMEAMAMQAAAKAYFLEPHKRAYWLAVESRLMVKVQGIKDKLNPESRVARERREKLDRFLVKFGWDALWAKFLESEKGSSIANKWGI